MSPDSDQPPIKTSLTPTKAQQDQRPDGEKLCKWLERGLSQPGGKLPIFDEQGQIEKGWAEPWFDNPIKPDWIVCKLTEAGRLAVSG